MKNCYIFTAFRNYSTRPDIPENWDTLCSITKAVDRRRQHNIELRRARRQTLPEIWQTVAIGGCASNANAMQT